MMRRILIVCFTLLLSSAWIEAKAANTDDPSIFRPVWNIGDEWTVSTAVNNIQATALEGGASNQTIVLWRFRVEEVRKLAGIDCYRLVVVPADERERPQAVVWVDRRTMAIRQIQAEIPSPGGYRMLTESYSTQGPAAPVVGPLTALPLDLPQFPPQGVKALDSYVYESTAGPLGTKALGDIGFSTEIRQTIQSAGGPKDIGVEEDATEMIAVELTTSDYVTRQVWAQGSPWPISSNNGMAQSRLVEVRRAEQIVEGTTPIETEAPLVSIDPTTKSLAPDEGHDVAMADKTPWSGTWWPLRHGGLIRPLGKYDRLTGSAAVAWESANREHGEGTPQWHGFCHAWAASSILEFEPVKNLSYSMGRRNRFLVDIGSQKGMLAACHTQDLANAHGDRYGDGNGSEDPNDLTPDHLWRLLKLYVQRQRVPLVVDVEAGPQVWNFPVFQFEIDYERVQGNQYRGNLTLYMADDAVHETFVGVQVRKQDYTFTFELRDGNIVTGSGRWTGTSREDHPDFAWYPYLAVAENPEVERDAVIEIVQRSFATPPEEMPAPIEERPESEPDSAEEVPETPETETTQPEPSSDPGNEDPAVADPPAEIESEENEGVSAQSPIQSDDDSPIVLSPLELVALIKDQTSSFGLDITVDRFDGGRYRIGESFFVRVHTEESGYFHLLSVDTEGEVTLLYPRYGENNWSEGGNCTIPAEPSKDAFAIEGPLGTRRIKAVVSSRPIFFTGSLATVQTQTQQQAAEQGEMVVRRPISFRWHPTQQAQVQSLLREFDSTLETNYDPGEILGEFAQDQVVFSVVPMSSPSAEQNSSNR